MWRGTPPRKASVRTSAPIQSARLCVQSLPCEGGGRLGVGVVRRPQHSDDHLRRAQLAGAAVRHLHRLPGIVHQQPLAGRVGLPHGRRQAALPAAAKLAPAAVAVAAGVDGPVFLPKQLQPSPRGGGWSALRLNPGGSPSSPAPPCAVCPAWNPRQPRTAVPPGHHRSALSAAARPAQPPRLALGRAARCCAREPDCAQICAHRHADARISVVKVLECSMYSIS